MPRTLPLVHFDVSFHWDPPACSSGGGEWWEIILGSATDTQHCWAASGSWMRASSDSALSTGPPHENLTGQQWCTPRRLNPWLLVVQGTGDCGQCDIHLHAWCWVYCSGPRRRAAILREDVEPIHEWQHQESWEGIQLHRQTAGWYGIYVHHSG